MRWKCLWIGLFVCLLGFIIACGGANEKRNYIECSREIIGLSDTIETDSDLDLETMSRKVQDACKKYGFRNIGELKAAYNRYDNYADSRLMDIIQKIESYRPDRISVTEFPKKGTDPDTALDKETRRKGKDVKNFLIGCKKGDKGRILYFLDKGVGVNVRDRGTGETGLHHAVVGLHFEIVEILLERGADPNVLSLEGFNALGNYVLYSAGTEPSTVFDKGIAEYLLQNGADVNARTTRDIDWSDKYFIPAGSTILDVMTAMNDQERINFLVKHGAKHGTWAKYYLGQKVIDEVIEPLEEAVTERTESKKKERSPAEVVKAAYMAGNRGNYSETEDYLHPELFLAIIGSGGVHALKKVWDEATRNGQIERVEILGEEIRGEGAKVYFKIHYKGGKKKVDQESLIKEGKRWQIMISEN